MVGFHDRFWWPPDEGNYAHVAERVLRGETLHRDVQDVHAGYVDFVHAAAFALFGTRLVSLRYPVAFLSLVLAALVFLLLRPRGPVPAAVGSIAITSLGFVQFLDPSANWYGLFLAVGTIGWLRWLPPRHFPYRDLGTGFLVGLTFLFRQLSGVLLGIGVLVYLVLERRDAPEKGGRLPRAVLLVLGSGLAAYLIRSSEPSGWILLGIWPFLILAQAWRRAAIPDRAFGATLVALGIGAVVAAAPLVAYHVVHGSVHPWVEDSFGAAVALSRLDFLRQFQGYLVMAVLAVRGLVSGTIAARVNGAFWLLLLLILPVLALLLRRSLARNGAAGDIHPLPVVAVFYGVGALHYQIPIYLFPAVALGLAGLLWQGVPEGRGARAPVVWVAAALAVVALYYHAGMPLSRGLRGTVAGERRATTTSVGLARAGLRVEAEDAARYREVVALIERETEPGDTILALPSNAELYFLSQRTNPFRFYNSAVGIRSEEELDAVLRAVRCRPPALVFHEPGDKYNTAASARIMDLVRARFDPLASLPPWQIYRRRDAGAHPDSAAAPCPPEDR